MYDTWETLEKYVLVASRRVMWEFNSDSCHYVDYVVVVVVVVVVVLVVSID